MKKDARKRLHPSTLAGVRLRVRIRVRIRFRVRVRVRVRSSNQAARHPTLNKPIDHFLIVRPFFLSMPWAVCVCVCVLCTVYCVLTISVRSKNVGNAEDVHWTALLEESSHCGQYSGIER